jgi:hypothetical protein
MVRLHGSATTKCRSLTARRKWEACAAGDASRRAISSVRASRFLTNGASFSLRLRRLRLRLDSQLPPDRRLELVRLEPERAAAAAIRDPAILPHEVEAVGGRRVGAIHLVVHVVHQRRDRLQFQLRQAGAGERLTFLQRERLLDDGVLAAAERRASVERVRLADVDDEERDPVAVRGPQFLQPTG